MPDSRLQVRAGCSSDSTFTFFLTKPSRIGGMTSVTGAPVTEDDKQLVRFLIDHGDGAEFNAALQKEMQAAADKPPLPSPPPSVARLLGNAGGPVDEEPTNEQTWPCSASTSPGPVDHKKVFHYSGSGSSWYGACKGATTVAFPESLASWCQGLSHLNLSNNTLTTLPEALFDLVNLEELHLAQNCIWTLSPRVCVLGLGLIATPCLRWCTRDVANRMAAPFLVLAVCSSMCHL